MEDHEINEAMDAILGSFDPRDLDDWLADVFFGADVEDSLEGLADEMGFDAQVLRVAFQRIDEDLSLLQGGDEPW